MILTVIYQGGTRFNITSSRHTVMTDQPIEDGGADAGMSPVELFVGSLAGCVGYFVARFCARHRIPADGLTIDAEWSMAEQPHRIGAVALRLRLPVDVTPAQQERLLRSRRVARSISRWPFRQRWRSRSRRASASPSRETKWADRRHGLGGFSARAMGCLLRARGGGPGRLLRNV